MNSKVMIGSDVWLDKDAEKTQAIVKLKLGNTVFTNLVLDKEKAKRFARFCRENGVQYFIREIRTRGHYTFRNYGAPALTREQFYSKKELNEILREGGESFGGRCINNESGTILYAPSGYAQEFPDAHYGTLPQASNVQQAHDYFMAYLKKFVAYERQEFGPGTLMQVDAGLTFKYQVASGIEVLAHEMMPGDPHLLQSGIRGTARAFGKLWGDHIAMDCYGGNHHDELWLKRFQTALHYCYVTGARFIWPEGAMPFDYNQRNGQVFSFGDEPIRCERGIQRRFFQFAQIHRRPDEGPRVNIGVIHGNLDGFPGLWNKQVWGQSHHAKWQWGAPEYGWELVNKFYRKENWNRESVRGDQDFSGNPPYGQYDVVPIESSLENLQRYSCLIFLGWNTMTPEIYRKLKRYVRAGGHLVMSLAHLSTHLDRAGDLKLYQGGDFRDLFGVQVIGKGHKQVLGVKCIAESTLKSYGFPVWRLATDPRFIGNMTPARVKVGKARVISGFTGTYMTTEEQLQANPMLVEHSVGRGKAFLMTVWEYPGDPGVREFTDDLLRTVLAGEQGEIRLLASDRVRYAVYDNVVKGRKYVVVYLLNTDPDCDSVARLWVRGKQTGPIQVPAHSCQLAYIADGAVVVPEDNRIDVQTWDIRDSSHTVKLYNCARQIVEIHNLGADELAMQLNGARGKCRPGKSIRLTLVKAVDPDRAACFADDYLSEPKCFENHTFKDI